MFHAAICMAMESEVDEDGKGLRGEVGIDEDDECGEASYEEVE